MRLAETVQQESAIWAIQPQQLLLFPVKKKKKTQSYFNYWRKQATRLHKAIKGNMLCWNERQTVNKLFCLNEREISFMFSL